MRKASVRDQLGKLVEQKAKGQITADEFVDAAVGLWAATEPCTTRWYPTFTPTEAKVPEQGLPCQRLLSEHAGRPCLFGLSEVA